MPAPDVPVPAPRRAARVDRTLAWLAEAWPRIDARLFPAWVALAVAWQGVIFVGAMLHATGGVWSAPLDDVFIHFDYARATARGHPFEWSEGNGYSSGNTSVLYPFVLALGYWIGFRDLWLMCWSVLVAGACLVGFLHASAALARPLGSYARYLVPPVVLSVGALGWSLWSGMENALHLAVWGLALAACLRVERLADEPRRAARNTWWLGLAGALLVLVRPESAVCVLAFGVYCAITTRRGGGRVGTLLHVLIAAGLPAVVALAALVGANRYHTGEWSQAGAVAKLALNHPYLTSEEKWADWVGHFKYVFARNLEHHFSDAKPYGYVVPLLAAVPLAVRALRPHAILVWVQIFGWLAVVSLNGQVRWQNERYTMSAVAWLLVLAALGLGALTSRAGETLRARLLWGGRLALAGLCAAAFWRHQLPRYDDQVWFFARASRNILDQHVRAGRALREIGARRVLVGDAGALTYASDLPGLDIIGLGGFHDYPFARAGKHGLGASIELLERIPARDRPDLLAIYPGWWGDLPLVFGHYVTEFPVVGNVICGGASKVIYRADWSALERASVPRGLAAGETLVGELDVADLMAEKEARYVPSPRVGYVVWRVLADPGDPHRDLFDAGRILPPGHREVAVMQLPTDGGRLVARTVVTRPSALRVRVAGRDLGELEAEPRAGWTEVSIPLPSGLPASGEVEIETIRGEWIDYHLWSVGRGR